MGNNVIVGIDEAGRGALAGPVVAGACVLPADRKRFPSFIRDSKQLTPLQREEAFAWIQEHCLFGYGFVPAEDIDAYGILKCTERAMQEAVAMLERTITPTHLLVDGRDNFRFTYPHSSIVRGDQREKCISAGSIVAKVSRDHWMIEQQERFSQYGFAKHKGYGCEEHIRAIQLHGATPLHRKTFLRNILATEPVQPSFAIQE